MVKKRQTRDLGPEKEAILEKLRRLNMIHDGHVKCPVAQIAKNKLLDELMNLTIADTNQLTGIWR